MLRNLFFILGLLPMAEAAAQEVTALFSTRNIEIKYATFAPDGKSLAVANSRDSVVVFEFPSLKVSRVFNAFTSGSTITDSYTGRKIFHLTSSGNVIYVAKAEENKEVNLYLYSENVASNQLNFRLKLETIPRIDFPREKEYGRLNYSLSAEKDLLLFTLNGSIKVISITEGAILHEHSVQGASQAALSADQTQIACVGGDSLNIIDAKSGADLLSLPFPANSVAFMGDTVVAAGDEIALITLSDFPSRKSLYHHPGFIYGIEQQKDSREFTFSNSYFSDKGFTASYSRVGEIKSVYHLPRTDGFVSFFHPVTNDRYLVTTRGLLYHFNPESFPLPLSQAGHRSAVLSVDLSKNQRTLVTAASGGEILLWDIHTGRIKERYPTNDIGIEGAYLDDDGKDIICSSYGKSKRIHRSAATNAASLGTYNVFSDPAGQAFLESKLRRNEKARAELESLQAGLDLSKPFALSGNFGAGFSAEGKLRAINLSDKKVFDHEIPEVDPSFTNAIAFYNDHTVILEGSRNTIILYDFKLKKVVKRLGQVRPPGRKGVRKILFNAAGDTMATVVNDNEIQLWDLRRAEKIMQLTPSQTAVQEHALDLQGNKLAFINESNRLYVAAVADLSSGYVKMIAYLDTAFQQKNDQVYAVATKGKGYPMRLSLSPDGQELLVLRLYAPFSGKSEVFLDWWNLRDMTLKLTMPIVELSYPAWKVSWPDKMVAVWDQYATSKKEHASIASINQQAGVQPPAPTYPGILFMNFSQSAKMRELALDKLGIARLAEGSVPMLNTNEIWIRDNLSMVLHRVSLSKPSVKEVVDVSVHRFDERIGEYFTLTGSDHIIYAAHPWNEALNTSLKLWSKSRKQIIAHESSSGAAITAMTNVVNSGFAIGTNDNTISIRDAGTLKEKYRIVQDDIGRYAFITPEQFYKADRAAAGALQFSWKNRSYSLHQLDNWYNRPDKVMKAAGFARPEDVALLEKAYLKRRKRSGDLPTAEVLPEVAITNVQDIPFETAIDSIQIELVAKDRIGIVEARVLVDGVPVRVFRPTPAREIKGRCWVKLLPGKNKISVEARNAADMTSLRDEVEIEYAGRGEVPDLYIVTVAINEYQNTLLNLNYAVKDARDISRFFSQGSRYRNVFVDSVYNASATRENIERIGTKLRNARSSDMVIVFFAGHGVLDENFDFRFGTWALDSRNPSATAILYDDIERLLNDIKARKKLLLIDACHSGEVDKDEILDTTEKLIRERNGARATVTTQSFGKVHHNVFASGLVDRTSFELMQELFYASAADNGAQVVVATAGDSYAIESDKWRNGFFTYSILKGLSSLQADTSGDGKITIDEMVRYLRQEVKTMSEGKQVPRFRQENQDNYFVVWE